MIFGIFKLKKPPELLYFMGGNDDEPISGWWFGNVWNMKFIFPYIGNVIIPTDEVIFFRGVGIPPTRNDFWDFQI